MCILIILGLVMHSKNTVKNFLSIGYFVGNKAVQVLKLALISFTAFRHFLCTCSD